MAAAHAALVALRLSRRRIGLALVYHRVSEQAGDPALELNPAVATRAFTAQVRFFARAFRLVRASELRGAAAPRRRGQRIPLAITFDDDLPEHVRVAAPALREARAPATFFLCGSFLGGERFFWWEALQAAVDAGVLEPDDVPGGDVKQALASRPRAIHRLAQALEMLSPAERAEAGRLLAARAAPYRPSDRLGVDDARALAADFEVGFHTRRHDRLTGLDDAELADRLTEGRAALEELAGKPLRAIAYPHGKADARVVGAVRRASFAAGFTGEPTGWEAGGEPLLVGRLEPRAGEPLGLVALRIVRALLQAGARR